ncbi:hypothetical protein SEA_BOBBOB_75 [Gordonia phage BobBob]|uniref:Uncharacterized protein n=3 Tax=Vividuovirus TaxID=2560251 RepID=A0A142K9X8_9CAUD|nr:hypothetical protein BJD57_gp79 [Gordonia phage Vivi2]YP_010096867.1 hypothetical protein KNT97_gp75 [Gordonia phage Rofo]YP_010099656.1 hypothetical protein KNU23_gp77 [Gordonia phage Tangent]QDH92718.1 hypothetical protein SEA_CHARMING_78 [Gordonia phage Charming]UVF60761.1 hypothetical protein SEA_BOBBOB_75 [Gordonia phage BobBob]AMS02911.1 hypothetical protein SEA_VIVI2_79 [Gordonia phage Vivi2]AXH46652.1 hypothetical protein SEA_ROFO_75 [Gordonia phage Rofo]AYR03626.1 hypothetical pr
MNVYDYEGGRWRNDPDYETYREQIAERRAEDPGPPVDDFDPNPWFNERD